MNNTVGNWTDISEPHVLFLEIKIKFPIPIILVSMRKIVSSKF